MRVIRMPPFKKNMDISNPLKLSVHRSSATGSRTDYINYAITKHKILSYRRLYIARLEQQMFNNISSDRVSEYLNLILFKEINLNFHLRTIKSLSKNACFISLSAWTILEIF